MVPHAQLEAVVAAFCFCRLDVQVCPPRDAPSWLSSIIEISTRARGRYFLDFFEVAF
jgi:hypothetical protein